ncbi:glycosyltransferase family 87 protein [Micromonospora sp. 4G57]|uniref:Glycosyltransferase family 87 protein n=1 Tax=Micromonospora sicca TaxID=2202420 RepID=A0ABU5J875_9ACTN|nr:MULTISPECIES: glycosyltransferase family 87 protein [unclassified Micromonospora]MDZ5442653.1 glycosyltransferase family 87 protein [Micromonospora sp. 4G57]MDZ5488766.1 glycosyltransferase family 87 protein [Micromonospora sp. 4G53]
MAQGARRTYGQVAGVLVLAVAVAAFLSVAAVRHGFFDLKVYYGALTFWVHDGGEIYDFLKAGTQYGFTYPPFAALVMLPMAYLPWPAAITVSVAASVLTSAVLIWWLVDPIARRAGWTRWFALAVALCLAAAFEPMRETVNFGQVNTLLLFLVAVDLLRLLPAGNRWAGVGIGLATAIKLTPGVFIVYLLVTRRWRAAFTAMAAAAGASLLAAALFPDASREFWTEALWNTGRVGELAFVSNQSLRGVVARLDPEHPSTLAWLALVLATLAVWAWRSRAAVAAGDEATGLALTGAMMCLVSPVTWVHHLVWLIPGLILLVDNAMAAPGRGRRRRVLLAAAIIGYGFLISRIVWAWEKDFTGVDGFLGSNTYVWISLALLLGLPIRRWATPTHGGPRREPGPAGSLAEPGGIPQLDKTDGVTSAGERHRVGGFQPVG